MKKISYRLNLALVGSNKSGNDSGKRIFVDYLKNRNIELNLSKEYEESKGFLEYFIVYKHIPIKTKVFLFDNLENLISDNKNVKKFDVIILALNLYDLNSIDDYKKENYLRFKELFQFRGLSVLVGIDVNQIFGRVPSPNSYKISKENLIKKAKELNLIYCYELKYKYKDLFEFYDKILSDFVFKFQISHPELFNQAKSYGKELISQFSFLKDT